MRFIERSEDMLVAATAVIVLWAFSIPARVSIPPLLNPHPLRWSAFALPAAEPIAQAPDLHMLLNAILADQLIRRNLHLSAAFAAHADDLSPAEIIERRICPIDEAAVHQSPGVECGSSGGSLLIRHLVSRIRSRIVLAKKRGTRRSDFRPQVTAQHLFGGPGNRPFRALGVGHGVGIGHAPYETKTGTLTIDCCRLFQPIFGMGRGYGRRRYYQTK
jgi:hypothetical protein